MQRDVLERRELSRRELQDLRNKRTGVTIFQLSWMLVFVCLIVVNLQIRNNFVSWPPPGVDPLDRVLPTAATVGLIASLILTRSGVRGIANDRRESLRFAWRGALALGAVFIGIMAYEWVNVPISGQYSTVFRVMTAFHAVHALVIGIIMASVYRNADAYDSVHYWAVEAAAKLWYFVVVAWILFFAVLYII
jgi:heme/copper-type cytochrome/quinol oxidase subunit 3